jgi:PAS domain S-box-containing protein
VSHLNHAREISDLRPGSHLLCLYETEEEHRAWITPFLREGLERGERVSYLHDAHASETILDYLRADGVEVERYLATGQLDLREARAALLNGGKLAPEAALLAHALEVERAVEHGYTGLRVTWEMSWATQKRTGSGCLMELECKSQALFADHLLISLCQYDRRCFTPAQLLEAIAVHPEIISAQGRHRNIFFSTPRHLLGECSATDLLEHRLEMLAARSRTVRRLEEELEATTQVLDALDAMVAVLDRQGRIVFLNRAWEESWGHDLTRQRGRALWELAPTIAQRDALETLLNPDAPETFPRRYVGKLALGKGTPRQMTCTAQLLSHPAGRERVVLTVREG